MEWIKKFKVSSLTFSLDLFAVLVSLHGEGEVVSSVNGCWETLLNHFGVGEQDSVEGKASSLDWVFVHFFMDIK